MAINFPEHIIIIHAIHSIIFLNIEWYRLFTLDYHKDSSRLSSFYLYFQKLFFILQNLGIDCGVRLILFLIQFRECFNKIRQNLFIRIDVLHEVSSYFLA
jgi:hypothetical protein